MPCERWSIPPHRYTLFERLEMNRIGEEINKPPVSPKDDKFDFGCFVCAGLVAVAMLCFTAYMIARLFAPAHN